MDKWELHIEFEADPEWKPLDVACWFYCPLACLTGLSQACRAKKAYDESNLIICPMYKYGRRIKNDEGGN